MLLSVLRKAVFAVVVNLVFASLPCFAVDKLLPSFDPPAGLAVDSVPLFVVMGFDDNCYVDGMEWVLDLLKDKKNPVGTKNPETFDNMPIGASFNYISSALDEGGDALLNLWKRAVAAGYEVGNHTITHNTHDSTSLQTWLKEMSGCRTKLSQVLSVPESDILGFRAPYLRFNENTYTSISQEKMLYGCTMTQNQDYNKGMFTWPYTLDNGFADKVLDGWTGKCKLPGIWEIPVYSLGTDATMWPPYTGFDSSILTQAIGSQFGTMLKNGIDYRVKAGGNRAPMTIGLHTDVYSPTNDATVNYMLNCSQRREALTAFITYALTKPMVRFVSAIQLINWLRKPVPLGRTPIVAISEQGVKTAPTLSIGTMKKGSIQISVSQSGIYAINIYTGNGRMISNSIPVYCAIGHNDIGFNGERLSAGAYLIQITGAGKSCSKIAVISGK